MSEQKFESILAEVQKINERVTKIETEQHCHGVHIQQPIQIVGKTNVNFGKSQHDTTKRFNRVDRSLRLVESDLDLILQY